MKRTPVLSAGYCLVCSMSRQLSRRDDRLGNSHDLPTGYFERFPLSCGIHLRAIAIRQYTRIVSSVFSDAIFSAIHFPKLSADI